jgi:catechol 2,3-dioxygenase-like lactoylglutathione lyase family enzyme
MQRRNGDPLRPPPHELNMTIRLDHTIVPAKDKLAAANFFAHVFGLTVEPDPDHFAKVRVNESLTLAFADEAEAWGGPGFDPGSGRSEHYAFHVGDAEFDGIYERVKALGVPYGSDPWTHENMRINTRRGGRGFYFEDPNGHLLEVMTVPETRSERTGG